MLMLARPAVAAAGAPVRGAPAPHPKARAPDWAGWTARRSYSRAAQWRLEPPSLLARNQASLFATSHNSLRGRFSKSLAAHVLFHLAQADAHHVQDRGIYFLGHDCVQLGAHLLY